MSKKQPIVSISLEEATYIAETTEACQVVWLRRLLKDFGQTKKEVTTIFYGNISVISLSKNNVFHKKRKHIDTRFHFIRELVKKGKVNL